MLNLAGKKMNTNLRSIFCLPGPTYGPRREKTCHRGFANNTDADQPAHPCSLICAIVIRVLESAISQLAASEISLF